MEEICRPYIIYLTDTQEQALQQYIIQNSWKITVFKSIHHDLQFLVDLMIHGENLDMISFIKDSVIHNTKRRYGKRKIENSGTCTTLERQEHCCDVSSNDEDEQISAKEGETLHEKRVKNKPQNENMQEDIIQENFKERKKQDCIQETNVQEARLEVQLQGELNEVKTFSDFDDGDEMHVVKGRTGVSACIAPNRHRKYTHKKLANNSDRRSSFSCEICGKVAASERYLLRHLEKLHSEEAQKRKLEGKKKKQDQELNVCHICKKQFADKYALTAHHHNIHGGKKDVFQCDLCGAIVKHKGSLVQHKKSVHSNQRPHKCDVCGSKFKLFQQLKTHRRRHDPDFVETCTICGKTLKKGHLSTHMKRHTNDRKYSCDKCSKTFYEKQDLERHIILHSGEKPNKCPHCSYACSFKGNLTKHIKVRHETDMYMPELQEDKSYTPPKLKSNRKINSNVIKSQPDIGLLSEHHKKISTHIYGSTQMQFEREETGAFSSVQNPSRRMTENSWTDSGNKPRIEDLKSIDMGYQTEVNEGFKRHCVPSVHVFSDTDSQSGSFTSDSQLQILKPVQHLSEQLVHNLPSLDQDVNSVNFIEF